MEDSRVVLAVLVATLLLVPHTVYALPAEGDSSSSGTSISGGLIRIGSVSILVPYIPKFPTLNSTGQPYQITKLAEPSMPAFSCSLTSTVTVPVINSQVTVPNPLNIVGCITSYMAALLVWFPGYIEAVIANSGISLFNAVAKDGSRALDEVWNVLVGALNVPIDLFDGITTGLGAVMLGGILSIGEPWSLFLVPVIWLFVSVLLVLMAVAMVWGVKELIKAVKGTTQQAVDLA